MTGRESLLVDRYRRAAKFVRDVFHSTRHDDRAQRHDTDQPWVCWRFLSTDARTRITGRSVIDMDCCICGQHRKLRLRIPRFGPVPDRGKHPARVRFLLDHLHPESPHPMSWAKPLRNLAVYKAGIPLDLLRMRLEADLNEGLRDTR